MAVRKSTRKSAKAGHVEMVNEPIDGQDAVSGARPGRKPRACRAPAKRINDDADEADVEPNEAKVVPAAVSTSRTARKRQAKATQEVALTPSGVTGHVEDHARRAPARKRTRRTTASPKEEVSTEALASSLLSESQLAIAPNRSALREIDIIKEELDLAISTHRAHPMSCLDAVEEALREMQADVRPGLAALRKRAEKFCKERHAEKDRLRTMLQYEEQILADERARLADQGCVDIEAAMDKFAIVGVDEVGVGPLVGPLVSGAVALRLPVAAESHYGMDKFAEMNDSKKLKEFQRELLADQIKRHCLAYEIGICSAKEVDELNPRAASMEAMRRAVTALLAGPLAGYRVHLLVDYHTVPGLPSEIGQTSMEKGDGKSQSIAAASIVAKVYRDAYMVRLHNDHPHFGFDRNAGYGTREHMAALQRGLLCPEHRLSFAPVRAAAHLIQQQNKAKTDGTTTEDVEMAVEDEENVGPVTEGAGNKEAREQNRRARRSSRAAVRAKERKTRTCKSVSAHKGKSTANEAAMQELKPLEPRFASNATEVGVKGDDEVTKVGEQEEQAEMTSDDAPINGAAKPLAGRFTFAMPTLQRITRWFPFVGGANV